MGRSRDLARIIADSSGAIAAANLANAVPADGSITTAKLADAAITNAKIAAMAASKLTGQVPDANAPSGSVIQVVQGATSGTASFTSSAVKLFEATITPQFASSSIFVMAMVNIGGGGSDSRYTGLWLRRNGSDIAIGNKGGSAGTNVTAGASGEGNIGGVKATTMLWQDTPGTTSPVTYSVWAQADFIGGGRINYFNRPENLADAMRLWTPSNIVMMEIAG